MVVLLSSLVEALIHASPVRGTSEEAGSVMCVIRRCEDPSAALIPVGGGPPAITAKPQDQIVFRLDCNFSVLCMITLVYKIPTRPLGMSCLIRVLTQVATCLAPVADNILV